MLMVRMLAITILKNVALNESIVLCFPLLCHLLSPQTIFPNSEVMQAGRHGTKHQGGLENVAQRPSWCGGSCRLAVLQLMAFSLQVSFYQAQTCM